MSRGRTVHHSNLRSPASTGNKTRTRAARHRQMMSPDDAKPTKQHRRSLEHGRQPSLAEASNRMAGLSSVGQRESEIARNQELKKPRSCRDGTVSRQRAVPRAEVEQRRRRSWIDLVFEKPRLAEQQRANTMCPVSRSLSSGNPACQGDAKVSGSVANNPAESPHHYSLRSVRLR